MAHKASCATDQPLQGLPELPPGSRAVLVHSLEQGTFGDCLRAGHSAWVVEEGGVIHAYSVMAVAAGEAHLLNLCVRPRCHGRGFGRVLLSQMLDLARARGVEMMFLEVRTSNVRAIGLYHKAGFAEVGTRPGYYPAHEGKEDALILAMDLSTAKHAR